MGADENKAVLQQFAALVNAHDTAGVAALLADDFRYPPGDGGLDREAFVAVLAAYFRAFPDLHYRVEELVADGDTVVARLTMSGTHDGEYDGHAPTGRRFQVDEIDVYRVVDGRIASYRIVWDELGFRRQLGLPLG